VETCPVVRYKICAVIDALPVTSGEFLWGPRLLQGLGGFEGMRGEATEIVRGVFKEHPLDLVRMAGYTISSTFIAHAPAAHLGALTRLRNWSDRWLVDIVERKFGPSAVSAYRSSFQSRDAIPRRLLRAIDNVTLPVAIVALMTAGLAAFHRRLQEPTALAVVVALGFIINNAVCALGSGVFDRYQARVSWLFLLSSMLIAFQLCQVSNNRA
jgi:hypothetical protein